MFEAAVNKFINDVNDITKDGLMSVVLHGSFVLNDYRPGLSDLDFFAVWKKRPRPLQLETVMNLRKSYRNSHKMHLSVLEGEFVMMDDILNDDYRQVVYWGTGGQRITDSCGTLRGFNLMNIRENGFVAYGEDIRDMLPEPTLEQTDGDTVHCWKTLRDHYKPSENKTDIRWILMAARALAWLHTGQLMSKTESAEWLLDNPAYVWTGILPDVLRVRKNPLLIKDAQISHKLSASLGEATLKAIEILENELNEREMI